MTLNINRLISSVFIVLMFLFSIVFYPFLPLLIPIHWNASGIPDSFGSKNFVFLMPIVALILFFLFLYLPRLDPLKKNYVFFQKAYDEFILIFMFFLFYLHILSIIWNFYKFSFVHLLIFGFSILLIAISRLVKNVKMNWFVGIRTPWTLSDSLIWDKTHAFASKVFLYLGILIIPFSFILDSKVFFIIFLFLLLLAVIWIIGYSYYLFAHKK